MFAILQRNLLKTVYIILKECRIQHDFVKYLISGSRPRFIQNTQGTILQQSFVKYLPYYISHNFTIIFKIFSQSLTIYFFSIFIYSFYQTHLGTNLIKIGNLFKHNLNDYQFKELNNNGLLKGSRFQCNTYDYTYHRSI